MPQEIYNYPNVTLVRAAARAAWEKKFKKQTPILEKIGQTIPYWLVIVAAVFFVLSFPHTKRIFEMLTPTYGVVAPFGVEFGLLYIAFRRKQVNSAGARLSTADRALSVLLATTSVLVNGAGSLVAVVDASGDIKTLSIMALIERWGVLPATSQVALVLVPMAAFIIPIGTIVAGEGLAALFLERRQTGTLLDERWAEVGPAIEFVALRDAAINNHIPAKVAVRWASQIVGSDRPQVSTKRHVDRERTPADTSMDSPVDSSGQRNGHRSGQGYTKVMDARAIVQRYLADNPGAENLSSRELGRAAGVSKSIAADELAKYRNGVNGHEKNY